MTKAKIVTENARHSLIDEVNSVSSGLAEARNHLSGKENLAEEVFISQEIDVKKIREKIRMSQDEFAKATNFKISTLRNWEQGVRKPDQSTRIFLALLEKFPEDILKKIQSLKIAS